MNNKLTNLTLTELYKRKSTIKGALIAFVILALIAAGILIYLKPKPALYIPLMVLPVTWLPIFISLAAINKEISVRNTQTEAKV